MSAPKRIVFVADDLGVSAGTNAGIVRVADRGLVREASLCVTGAAVREGVRLAHEAGVGVGLHVSFTLGQALTGPIASLTDAGGRFLSLQRVLAACLLGRPDPALVAREVNAQFEAARALGVSLTHVNGHHHVHVFPVVRDAVVAAARRHGVTWTRMPEEQPAARTGAGLMRLLLSRLARQTSPLARDAGLRWLPFAGLSLQDTPDIAARLAATAARLPAGDHEWMVHPRVLDADAQRLDPRGASRQVTAEAELEALAAWAASDAGVRPTRYADLDALEHAGVPAPTG